MCPMCVCVCDCVRACVCVSMSVFMRVCVHIFCVAEACLDLRVMCCDSFISGRFATTFAITTAPNFCDTPLYLAACSQHLPHHEKILENVSSVVIFYGGISSKQTFENFRARRYLLHARWRIEGEKERARERERERDRMGEKEGGSERKGKKNQRERERERM